MSAALRAALGDDAFDRAHREGAQATITTVGSLIGDLLPADADLPGEARPH